MKATPKQERIAVIPYSNNFSSYPSNGLTPVKLANILKEADEGNVYRQMELFEEMEEKDAHLFAQLQTRKLAITGLEFEIKPLTNESEKDKNIAKFVERSLRAMEDFEEAILDLLDAIGKGYAVSEIMWNISNGFIQVEKINRVHQKWFDFTDDEIMKLVTKDEPAGIALENNKFITHKYKARSGMTQRAGILRVCTWMYLFKNYTVKDWVTFAEVYGMPIRLGKYAQGASEEDKTALINALIQLGTDACGMMPDNAAIEIIEANKTSSIEVFNQLARYCDEQMSKAILGQTMTSDSGSSLSQAEVHNQVREDILAADCRALAATLRRDLIRPLVMYNFGTEYEHRLPYIEFKYQKPEDLQELSNLYKTLVQDVGLDIEASHIYEKFNIPIPEDGAKTVKKKEDSLTMSLKDEDVKQQEFVDKIAAVSINKAKTSYESKWQKIYDLVDKAKNLDEIKSVLSDQHELLSLMGEMDDKKTATLLENGMLACYLEGMLIENGS